MGLAKHLKKALIDSNSLQKKEDPQAYAKLASTGFILAHPVKINGQEKRHDNGIPYHASVKFFDKESDDQAHAHKAAAGLDHQSIDSKHVGLEPKILKDRNGNDVYAIGLKGSHADKLKEQHNKLSNFGHKENYEWNAHISVPKSVHDDIKSKRHKTAHDAGIEFGHAELRRGPKTIETYHPKMKKSEELEKGALKTMLAAGSMAAALASPHTTDAKVPSHSPLHTTVSASPNNGYTSQKMLNAISQVESSGGKNMNHKPTSMGTAYGRFAEMPDVIHDTIRLNPDLKRQHGKALRLQGDNLNRYMQDNKGLEDLIAQKHLGRLEHHFGHNPEVIAFGWNQGITGTNRALKSKQNISAHPYVQKFKHYYESEK